jgi:hypothetical protein
MKSYLSNIFFLIILFTTIACSKIEVASPIEFQKQLLSGTGTFQNSKHIWQLDSTHVNGGLVPLTISAKNYKKTFNYDGGYSDTDNNNGVWEINSINKLKQTLIFTNSLIQDSLTYDIVFINSIQLKLSKKLSNGQIAIYSFKIVN